MKRLLVAAALLGASALSAPAFADTLKEVTSKGISVNVQGTVMDIAFTEDGNFASSDGAIAGTWKVDGPKLCLTVPGMIENQCNEYPTDKKSGDTFEVTTEMGPIQITIK